MKLALLGADAESLAIVKWATEQRSDGLIAAYDSRPHAAEIHAIAPSAGLSDNWEDLLPGTAADVVVIGRGTGNLSSETGVADSERRADQLRKLTQAAVPMIVVCPACEAIVGFEIEMIRRDTKAVIVPYVPGQHHPALERLKELNTWTDSSPIGKFEQITMEREQADRGREAVLVQLARDIALLRALIGPVQTVTASGPPAQIGRDPLGPKPKELPSLANLSVHLGGQEGLAARWSVSPSQHGALSRLTALGERGKAVLSMPAHGRWTIELNGETETFDAAPGIEEVFSRVSQGGADEPRDDSAWLASCRDQEAAEAVDRSLIRGRTIELLNEEHTEEESFKGIMAMGGCLLLLMAMGMFFLATIVEGLRLPIRGWVLWRLWPYYLLAPIAAFLLLQLLQLAIKREDRPIPSAASSGDAAS